MSASIAKIKDVHKRALREFDYIVASVQEERDQCYDDRRFCLIAGAQWEGAFGDSESGSLKSYYQNRPMLEMNKIYHSVNRINSELRQNRISVQFESKDGLSGDANAEALNGLYRAMERYCGADEAYDTAASEAVTGGLGAWRLCSKYEDEGDEENDQQIITIEPIFDADKYVFWDLGSKRQDKADAKYCFVLNPMTPQDFEEEYGEDLAVSWDKGIWDVDFDWATDDYVYVAEYYVKKYENITYYFYEHEDKDETKKFTEEQLLTVDDDDEQALVEKLALEGWKRVNERKIEKCRVYKYLMSGTKILEGPHLIPGPHIPVIPVYGHRHYINNIERCFGHVRFAKDAQRLKNMQVSKLAEISSLFSHSKPIFAPEQVEGYENVWKNDNIENHAFLPAGPVRDISGNPTHVGPLGFTQPPQVPPALAQLLVETEKDMQDILGVRAEAERIQSNVSGDAVALVQTWMSLPTFIYHSNMKKAIQRTGEVWLGMAREIYVEPGRTLKVVNEHGEIDSIQLLNPQLDINTMELMNTYDFSKADFDVVATVGPASETKRAAASKELQIALSYADNTQYKEQILAGLLMNFPGDGMTNFRKYFRKQLVQMGVEPPTKTEAEEMRKAAENAQPDANERYLMAAAAEQDAKARKHEADIIMSSIEAEKKQAEADKIEAETIETVANIDINAVRAAMDLLAKVVGPRTQQQPSTQQAPPEPMSQPMPAGEEALSTKTLERLPTPGDER